MIALSAARYPEKPAFIELSSGAALTVSYHGFYTGACRTAEKLARMDLPPGAKVVLMGANSPGWGAACLGIHLAGLTVTPLDPEITDNEVRNILSFLKPEAAACDRFLAGRFAGSVPRIIELESIDFSPGNIEFKAVPIPEDQPLSIVFTSGSTSTPKGVMLSEKNLLHNVIDTLISQKGLIGPADRLLNLLPLHHVYPFTATLLTPLCIGTTIIYPRSLKGEDITSAAAEQRATIMAVVPGVLNVFHRRIFSSVAERPLIQRMLFRILFKIGSLGLEQGFRPGRYLFRSVHSRMPDLRFFACGGARLDPGIHRDLAGVGFRILEAYGLSETAPIVTVNSLQKPLFGSVGRPAPGVEIKLVRPDPDIEEPEVLVRGPNVMLGYFNAPETTKEAFLEGWFRTGDLGHFDSQGNLFLSGRSKEIIVMSSGKNIYPEELEKVYSRSELIDEVCICRLEDEKGENLTAVVVPSREALKRKRTTNIYEDIKFEIENFTVGLPSYQRVTRVMLYDEPFPKTRLGKLKRYKIMETLGRGKDHAESKEDTEIQAIETEDELLAFVRRTLKWERKITGKENLELDLGLDSLTKLEFLSAFERHFGLALSDEEAGTVLTINHLRPFLAASYAGGVPGEARGLRKRDSFPPLGELVDLEESLWGRLFRFWGHYKLHLTMRLLFRARVSGIQNLPREGAYIIAPNHVSYLDGLLIHAVVPYRVGKRLFALAIADIFDHFPFSLMCYRGRIIKTGTLETTAQSLQYTEELLRLGFPLCLFPEGKRSIDGKVDEPKPGVARLALGCRAPLIPAHIRGTGKLLSRMNPGFRLGRVAVEFLPAIPPEGKEKELLERWLKLMRERDPYV
ncbi:MAG TPA: AMP-binding protein [archaeon]|nr:AMP-binding protein [archaeon]